MAAQSDQGSLLLTKAWAAAPSVTAPPAQPTVVGYLPDRGFVPAAEVTLQPTKGPCYGDGSAYHNRFPELATAGWAMVQLTEEGQLVGAKFGSVPNVLPQTAAAGEHYASLGAWPQGKRGPTTWP